MSRWHSRDSSCCCDPGEPSRTFSSYRLGAYSSQASHGVQVRTGRAVQLPRHESQPAPSAALRIQKLGRFLQIRDEGEGNLAGEGPRRERPFLQSPEH